MAAMRITSNQPLVDVATTGGSVVAIALGLTLLSPDVREFMRNAIRGDVHPNFAVPDVRFHSLMRLYTDTVGRDHTEVALFVLAGLVLFLLMFKL